jgi:hypothetical protein
VRLQAEDHEQRQLVPATEKARLEERLHLLEQEMRRMQENLGTREQEHQTLLSTVADLSAALVHPEAETKEKPIAAPRKRRKPAAD